MVAFLANIACPFPPLLKIKHVVPYYSKRCIITFNVSVVKKKKKDQNTFFHSNTKASELPRS